jgi:hypothetical protein
MAEIDLDDAVLAERDDRARYLGRLVLGQARRAFLHREPRKHLSGARTFDCG